MTTFRSVIVLAVFLLPPSKTKNRLLRAAGHDVSLSARIGVCLCSNVKQISIGDLGRIGHFNVFRDLSALILGPNSGISQWNWISAAKPLVEAGGRGSLTIGEHSAVTSRHYIDASGGVDIGRFTTVAGVRSTFITHGINWRSGMQSFDGITIGDYCILSSNVNIAPGAVVPHRSVVAMGSTLGRVDLPEGGLLLSSRAEHVKKLDGEYFSRDVGYISSVEKRTRKF